VREFELSVKGRARRERMLADLKATVIRLRRRRATVRLAGLGAVVVLAVALLGRLRREEAPAPVAGGPPESPQAPAPPLEFQHLRFEVVRNEPGVLERHRLESRPLDPAVFIDDDELLSLLAQDGRHVGLIRMQGRVIVTGDVPMGTP